MVSSSEVERLLELREEADKIESIISKRALDVFKKILGEVPKSISECHINNVYLDKVNTENFSMEWASLFRGEADDWGTLVLPNEFLYSDEAVNAHIEGIKQGYIKEEIALKKKEEEEEAFFENLQRRLYEKLRKKYSDETFLENLHRKSQESF